MITKYSFEDVEFKDSYSKLNPYSYRSIYNPFELNKAYENKDSELFAMIVFNAYSKVDKLIYRQIYGPRDRAFNVFCQRLGVLRHIEAWDLFNEFYERALSRSIDRFVKQDWKQFRKKHKASFDTYFQNHFGNELYYSVLWLNGHRQIYESIDFENVYDLDLVDLSQDPSSDVNLLKVHITNLFLTKR